LDVQEAQRINNGHLDGVERMIEYLESPKKDNDALLKKITQDRKWLKTMEDKSIPSRTSSCIVTAMNNSQNCPGTSIHCFKFVANFFSSKKVVCGRCLAEDDVVVSISNGFAYRRRCSENDPFCKVGFGVL
jgi:hypothetical protein